MCIYTILLHILHSVHHKSVINLKHFQTAVINPKIELRTDYV
jgi:hypothetical protein